MKTKKNYRLRDLMLEKEDWDLLNEISLDIRMTNSDLARLLLHQELMRIKSLGVNTFRLSITGIQGGDENGKAK
ncbi:hypothetical protein KY313_03380 [Candidatus Woesearchaeota archaeon]|nr:hypothetical protein [Candidatus Woesearchaeota archaeon]